MFKLYTQENCPNCDELKMFLNEKGISYDEVDVNNDTKARAFMIMNDLDTTPAVAMNDSIISGAVVDMKSRIESML